MSAGLKGRGWALLGLAAALCLVGCRPSASIPEHINVKPAEWEPIRVSLSEGGGGGGATEVARPDPTGFATLTGSFSFAPADVSKLPQPRPLEIGGDDAAYCSRAGERPMSQSVVVDSSTGGLKNVVIFLADDIPDNEKWVHASAAPGNSEAVIFDQKGCVFLSHVLALQVSQPLEIHNSDAVGHNTKLDNSGTPFNQIVAAGGQVTYEHTKEERAPYPASCSIHPWMSAYILPRKNGYFAVSGPDGKFKIENLPAGVDLTFKVWQEHVKFVKAVTVNGKAEQWPNKGFKLKLEPGSEYKLEVVLDPAPFAG